ncbi:MAG: hypothetical protein KJO26_09055 [Deltaproteobacteria bacterium]|nr:hypothetical protein [Deltaproteobacteria bacterium]
MDEYHKEQYETILNVKDHLSSLLAPQTSQLRNTVKDYLLFRERVNTFLSKHFSHICNQKCYQNKLSACCSREGIITFFADVVINALVSKKNQIEQLLKILQQPNKGFKCVYLGKQGCMWCVKPIVCEMFLCDQAINSVFDGKPLLQKQWKAIEQERKLYTWPDKPIVFDMLESVFIAAGYDSPLMYMHNSPGLLRLKKSAQRSKQ